MAMVLVVLSVNLIDSLIHFLYIIVHIFQVLEHSC